MPATHLSRLCVSLAVAPGYRLRFLPGTAAHYSNIGFDLLADALSAAAGKTLPPTLCRPDSQTPWPAGYDPEPDSRRVRSPLVGGASNQGHCTDTTAAAGSGGMYSTAKDMTALA